MAKLKQVEDIMAENDVATMDQLAYSVRKTKQIEEFENQYPMIIGDFMRDSVSRVSKRFPSASEARALEELYTRFDRLIASKYTISLTRSITKFVYSPVAKLVFVLVLVGIVAIATKLTEFAGSKAMMLAGLYVALSLSIVLFHTRPARLLFCIFAIVAMGTVAPDFDAYAISQNDNAPVLLVLNQLLMEKESSVGKVLGHAAMFWSNCNGNMTTGDCLLSIKRVSYHGFLVSQAIESMVKNSTLYSGALTVDMPFGGETHRMNLNQEFQTTCTVFKCPKDVPQIGSSMNDVQKAVIFFVSSFDSRHQEFEDRKQVNQSSLVWYLQTVKIVKPYMPYVQTGLSVVLPPEWTPFVFSALSAYIISDSVPWWMEEMVHTSPRVQYNLLEILYDPLQKNEELELVLDSMKLPPPPCECKKSEGATYTIQDLPKIDIGASSDNAANNGMVNFYNTSAALSMESASALLQFAMETNMTDSAALVGAAAFLVKSGMHLPQNQRKYSNALSTLSARNASISAVEVYLYSMQPALFNQLSEYKNWNATMSVRCGCNKVECDVPAQTWSEWVFHKTSYVSLGLNFYAFKSIMYSVGSTVVFYTAQGAVHMMVGRHGLVMF